MFNFKMGTEKIGEKIIEYCMQKGVFQEILKGKKIKIDMDIHFTIE